MELDPGDFRPESGNSVKRPSMKRKGRLKNRETSNTKLGRRPDVNLNSIHSPNKRAQVPFIVKFMSLNVITVQSNVRNIVQ